MSALWPSLGFKSLFVLKVIWTTQATSVWGTGRGLHTLTMLPQPILGGLPAHADHTFHSQYWGASCTRWPCLCLLYACAQATAPTMMLLPHPTELQTQLIPFQSSLYSKVQSSEALVPGQLLSLSVSSMSHWVFCEMFLNLPWFGVSSWCAQSCWFGVGIQHKKRTSHILSQQEVCQLEETSRTL